MFFRVATDCRRPLRLAARLLLGIGDGVLSDNLTGAPLGRAASLLTAAFDGVASPGNARSIARISSRKTLSLASAPRRAH